MLVVFHAGTVLAAAPVSVDATRFHNSHDAPWSANTFGGESSSLFSSAVRISVNDALNKFAERHVQAEPGCCAPLGNRGGLAAKLLVRSVLMARVDSERLQASG
jgi:hypothetical protein